MQTVNGSATPTCDTASSPDSNSLIPVSYNYSYPTLLERSCRMSCWSAPERDGLRHITIALRRHDVFFVRTTQAVKISARNVWSIRRTIGRARKRFSCAIHLQRGKAPPPRQERCAIGADSTGRSIAPFGNEFTSRDWYIAYALVLPC
jgi:hypothetical protein